jgi:hypothetical protein
MRALAKLTAIMFVVFLIGACAGAPTWKDMSEAEIASWKALGVEAGDAQTFKKAGLSTTDVEAWHAAGIKASKDILDWHKKGFTAEEAGGWVKEQFSLEEAGNWKKKEFTSEEAGKWKAAGFKLNEAVNNREKGLQPIQK